MTVDFHLEAIFLQETKILYPFSKVTIYVQQSLIEFVYQVHLLTPTWAKEIIPHTDLVLL